MTWGSSSELPKRTIITCQLTEAIAKHQSSKMLAVVLADLDRFKLINARQFEQGYCIHTAGWM
ncbi:MAG: diguanylate cyclase [Xenococcaceae cyanobacterium MO_167.B52]|nr:diguanylate cyclase [Xenococcaceae cyanobacterium MO_167.B52]